MSSLPAIPEPAFDADEAALPDGEAVAWPVALGELITLRFPSPFEPYLTFAGARVLHDGDGVRPGVRDALLWSSRRLPALWRALGERTALRATWVAGAGQDARIVVTDLVAMAERNRRDDDEPDAPVAVEWFDHGVMRERLDAAGVELARFSLLGSIGTKAELERRVRATYAPGTLVEVRIEDGKLVAARRRLRLGR
ncbi:MAG TPA: hypothetical protein VGO62_05045 [Myxococcota bacterium]